MQEIKFRKRVPVNIRQFLFERFERDEETLSKTKHYGFVYLAEIGHNDVPVFIVSKDRLGLGEQEIALRPNIEFEIASEKERDVVLTEDAFLKRVFEKEYKSRLATWLKNKEMNGWSGEPPTPREVFNDVCAKYKCFTYQRTTSVEFEELQKLSHEEIDEVFDAYLKHGWEVAPELYSIMRAGMIRFKPEAANQKLMKYRGHCLIVKPPKTGVSTISQRIGLNLDHLSTKSIEGHATADGTIQHSSLHDEWGHVNIDEFLEMPENILQHMFNYLEMGSFNTHKASRLIKNYGAPRICFTANPHDVSGIEFSKIMKDNSTEIMDENGHFHSARDEGKEKLMYTVFKQSLNQLTKVSNAAFSRLGIILFTPDLSAAVRTDKAGDAAYFDRADSIATSIIEILQEPVTKIFTDSESWLNQPMPEYEKKIDDYLKGTAQTDLKNAWCGQKDAYRHIRGHALAEAIIDHADLIISGKYVLEDVLETAEDNLRYAQEINIHSLRNVLLAVDKYENDKEVFAVGLENIRPSYVRSVLFAYLYAAGNKEEGETVPLEILKEVFEAIDRTKREPLGRDAYWSRFENRFNKNKLQRALSNLNLTQICPNGKGFLVQKTLLVNLDFSFRKMGLEVPEFTKFTKKEGIERGG